MGSIPERLRRLIVNAYKAGRGTYREIASEFGVGEASVSRLLRLDREGPSLAPKPHRGGPYLKVDDDWLRKHAASHPDARLVDRVVAWSEVSGVEVDVATMWHAMRRIGWTHKKRLRSRASKSGRM